MTYCKRQYIYKRAINILNGLSVERFYHKGDFNIKNNIYTFDRPEWKISNFKSCYRYYFIFVFSVSVPEPRKIRNNKKNMENSILDLENDLENVV